MYRLIVLLPFIAACGPRVDETWVDGLRRLSTTLETGRNGTGRLKVDVSAGESAMLVTGITVDPLRNHVRSVQEPGGRVVFDAFDHTDAVRSKTNGGFVAQVASLNWPVDATDDGLVEGRWAAELASVDASDQWSRGEVGVDVLLKEDDDLGSGALLASIVFVGGLQDDPAVVGATEAALEVWSELYGQMEITLDWDFYEYEEGTFAPPGLGSAEDYEAISAMTPLRSVNLVIAPEISGYDDIYGIAGDIPGPLVSSGRSAILISTLLAAGPDGRFSAEEQRLLGETLAHEAGHYLGLFHPVEADFDSWDALDDTPECSNQQSCIQQIGRNLMFPFPVCGFAACTPQDELTAGQAGVANRHVVVE